MSASRPHTRRLTTVHDVASLRVHPDGSRVPANPRPAGRPKRLHTRQARYTTKDVRGNWIARDAAGLGTVKKTITVEAAASGEEEEDGVVSVQEKDKGSARGTNAGSADEEGEEVGKRSEGYRARKRRRFENDYDFLGGRDSQIASQAAEASSSKLGLPVPSSDLLKCIHHFTSSYYASKGQLFNASYEYRVRRKEKLRKKKGKERQRNDDSSQEEDEGDEESQTEEDEQDDEVEEDEGDADEDEDAAIFKRRKRKLRPKEEFRRDMYKLFDGSVLMALGVLLQEHVASFVGVNLPPDGQPIKPAVEAKGEEESEEGQLEVESEDEPQDEEVQEDDDGAEEHDD
ncbi:hypothetical protein EVG20_g1731 [Dentipellis fragilis]|uniref:Uncharacterized protein n=1 Tax=Dentipellis fragilis TaxID=205917 RepID=A0A4Y9ZBB5_9AGAM|nr:hypothetical protein EVG20_g1731 [Dentipellis fragilis]